MSDSSNTQLSKNAQEFISMANTLLNEAIASCQLEAFKEVPLTIPMAINPHTAPPESASQEEIWRQITQLYSAQESLFNPGELTNNEDAPPANNETQIHDINKMLGM